ncbi:hypothetical protein A2118_02125 [Candidatus Kaiserbacteria bacterium GWA2_50_9]|uniref:Methyltransferase FkbM domain-containing protein n=1 Tax=Candidatus Kaiserbacteria bacterium GWA2_50_9 TaxID=1798474 RepID=A0A1F6BVR9_9BACT|nr:MAG: hypothetical protein A2118_02125 [Candidatus Kaiserbacteria bacterium GWA2_50_9]
MKNNNTVLSAYKKIIGNSDWYQTRSFSWPERLRRYPLLTLRYALIDRYWKIAIALGFHDSFLTARTFWGEYMQVTFPDYRCIYHHGLIDGRELPVEDFLVQFIKEGDVCVDVGANVGFYTLLFSALVGERGRVYAFEPTPRTFGILRKNSSDKQNVTLVNVALMEMEGERNLADYGAEKSGLNTVLPKSSNNGIRPSLLSVEVMTLDSYCFVHNIRPTFIKIDVEGAEEMVLMGGRKTLAEHHPVLIVEVQREASQPVVALLSDLGYQAYQFVDNTPVPFVAGDTLGCPNMLFMHDKTRRPSHD